MRLVSNSRPAECENVFTVTTVPGEPALVMLAGELDIAAEHTIKNDLVASGSSLALDLNGIRFADVYGTRLLVTRIAELSAEGAKVTCEGASPALARVLALVDSLAGADEPSGLSGGPQTRGGAEAVCERESSTVV